MTRVWEREVSRAPKEPTMIPVNDPRWNKYALTNSMYMYFRSFVREVATLLKKRFSDDVQSMLSFSDTPEASITFSRQGASIDVDILIDEEGLKVSLEVNGRRSSGSRLSYKTAPSVLEGVVWEGMNDSYYRFPFKLEGATDQHGMYSVADVLTKNIIAA